MAARLIFRDRRLPLRAKGGRVSELASRDWKSGARGKPFPIGKSVGSRKAKGGQGIREGVNPDLKASEGTPRKASSQGVADRTANRHR